MRPTPFLVLGAFAVTSLVGAQDDKKTAEAAQPAAVPMDKISYLMGREIAGMQNGQLSQQGLKLDLENYLAGARDGIEGKEPKFSREELDKAYQAFQAHMAGQEEKRAAQMKAGGDKARESGAKFLADNGKREGVTQTASGLQYEVLTKADGPKPAVTDTVSVHYRGTLLNGTEFDSSYKRGEPATFPLQGVIKGWTEALQLMPVGSKWKLFIPSELAYGERGAGSDIGPNETLVFEVELLGIVK